MGTNCTYLVHDGYYKAKSCGTSQEANDWVNGIAADLNELSALRDSHAELVEELSDVLSVAKSEGWQHATTGRQLILKFAEETLSRAQSLTSTQKPRSGHSDANAEAI